MNSVQSATEQQEHIGSFKRRLRKRRNGDAYCRPTTTPATGATAFCKQEQESGVFGDLVLLQKVYVKQFYFEKRVGSGGGGGGQQQKQEVASPVPGYWLLLLVTASASFGWLKLFIWGSSSSCRSTFIVHNKINNIIANCQLLYIGGLLYRNCHQIVKFTKSPTSAVWKERMFLPTVNFIATFECGLYIRLPSQHNPRDVQEMCSWHCCCTISTHRQSKNQN